LAGVPFPFVQPLHRDRCAAHREWPSVRAWLDAAQPGPGGLKTKARRLPRGSRRVVKGSLHLWRSTATVKAEAAGEQTEDDQDDPDQGVAEYERNNPEDDQQSASTEVHPAPPFLRIPIAPPTIGPVGVPCEESELRSRAFARN